MPRDPAAAHAPIKIRFVRKSSIATSTANGPAPSRVSRIDLPHVQSEFCGCQMTAQQDLILIVLLPFVNEGGHVVVQVVVRAMNEARANDA